MAIVYFVSLISRENRPIHIQEIQSLESLDTNELIEKENKSISNSDESLLKYHFLSNIALDVFLSPFYEGDTGIEQLLFTQDGINVYGFETNSGLKILIGTSDKIDSSFKLIFQKLHKIYLNLVLNPFQDNEELSNITINEKKLSENIRKVF